MTSTGPPWRAGGRNSKHSDPAAQSCAAGIPPAYRPAHPCCPTPPRSGGRPRKIWAKN